MADKKLVATTVSSREKGMKRREEQVTTSSHNETIKENRQRIKEHFGSKESRRCYLRHEDGDEMESIAAASRKRRSEEQQRHEEADEENGNW